MSWWFVYWQESNFQACLKPEPVHLEKQHDQDTHYLPWNESFDSNYNTRRFHVSSSRHVKSSNWVREQGRRLHVNSCSVTISRSGQQLFWTTIRVSNISILRLSPLKWSFCLRLYIKILPIRVHQYYNDPRFTTKSTQIPYDIPLCSHPSRFNASTRIGAAVYIRTLNRYEGAGLG